jgi:hypothetical protein
VKNPNVKWKIGGSESKKMNLKAPTPTIIIEMCTSH